MSDAPQVTLNVSASTRAPVLYSDWISSHGVVDGVATITFEAQRFMLVRDGERADDRVVVLHLRLPMNSVKVLEAVCGEVRQMAKRQVEANSTITPPGAAL